LQVTTLLQQPASFVDSSMGRPS